MNKWCMKVFGKNDAAYDAAVDDAKQSTQHPRRKVPEPQPVELHCDSKDLPVPMIDVGKKGRGR